MSTTKKMSCCCKTPNLSLQATENEVSLEHSRAKRGSWHSLNGSEISTGAYSNKNQAGFAAVRSRSGLSQLSTASSGPQRNKMKFHSNLPAIQSGRDVHLYKSDTILSLVTEADEKSQESDLDNMQFNQDMDTGKKSALSLCATPMQSQKSKTFYESNVGSELSTKRPTKAKLAILQESRRATLQKKAPLKRGSCMTVICAVPKACVTSTKKSVRLCAAPIKKCSTVCKPKALVPTPRLGAEWEMAGMKASMKKAAQQVVRQVKLLWFLFSLYVLVHIVVGFVTSYNYDPESFYPVKLGFSFWEKKANDGMECLDWFC